MPTPAHPAPPTRLPEDSLGYALLTSAELIAEVVGGTALTDALARLWAAHPATPAGVRGAILDLTYSTLRDYGRQDFILGKLLQKPLPEPVQSLLRVALHRLAVRPDTAHTVVDQAVSAASNLIGGKFKGVANGVLRNALRQSGELAQAADTDMVAEHRHPPWWIRRLKNQYPQKWRAILAAGNTHPPMALRVNPLRASDDEVLADFAAAGITVKRLAAGTLLLDQPLSVSRLPGFAEGCLSVQDAGAQHAARYLDLDDGQRVLDACAAPGGKSAHILETADVALTALDSSPVRAQRISENLARLGLAAEVKASDCRKLDAWWDGRPFERILADVPCSASGVVRRNPDIKWLRRSDDIPRFAAQQAEILEALWQTLAPGGKMLYATCSVFAEENGDQITAFAARHPDCRRLPIAGQLDCQYLPCAEHDGFFYALLEKTA
ncbi:MAG: putative tRNA and rRNA cytosine-C5-methylase [Pseudomonadota bacterium]|jgi:16S rRNA (cytosine967-C5)-methyltransferase|uniref:16S rRNA (cytosine(967)-C(5))-methyltransferase n=1 Tax=Zoogloea ramigera TaxID=350 RepID=A0A4Y4CS46_ZOORA|nr:16S rRNA (cytosine(967)-C(5))-methyltransferase RsmB [Zoogloea ramigera]MBP6800478.1 16S rRNA (cytosine(967)-C(5))-methyltransferase RsmB [Zoogloea sp.]GEC95765.1 ribosomal RNA small subunit methyltransferase B [Zoogloea ramigera]